MTARSFDGVRPGDEIGPLARRVRREDVKAYADASGDQNPLHQDDEFARSVGFPGIIAHGMFTMAHLAKAVTDWAGDIGALRRMRVQFRGPVFMDEVLLARGRVVETDEATRRVTVDVWTEVERDGSLTKPIKNSVAVVQLA